MGLAAICVAAALAWPEPTQEMKPWVYNWWMGSAVDEAGIETQCRQLREKGFGGFHVIPIYGAKGYEKRWRTLLSPEWLEAWNHAARTARKHGLGIDLTMGAGWCFGGPWVSEEDAASSKVKVKRAGPGGEGYMIDPFSPKAMSNHVAQFEAAFGKNGSAERPRAFYHDSYEYYNAHPKQGGDLEELQLKTFSVWSRWCAENGYLTRNEAHGSPVNWLDFYGLADIPETEMFGKNDRDILISKFASSAAHVKGTRLVSAESCTWIDEHFRERPEEIKRFLDRLFLSGVNHVFYHGLCYSPTDAIWPGWCFYASLQMNPRNPIWREVDAINAYVTRCQSIFQTWTPDNDLAIIWDTAPYYKANPGKPMSASVHDRGFFYNAPIGKVASGLYAKGYCFDYISPRQIKAGLGKKYRVVLDPSKERDLSGIEPAPFNKSNGLLCTRWRKGNERMYFVVNDGRRAVGISAGEKFTVMDALSGEIATVSSVRLEAGHSLFIKDVPGFKVDAAPARNCAETRELAGPWRLHAVCGGPSLPQDRTLGTLEGWEKSDESFSGTMCYESEFDGAACEIDLGSVREIARVWVNGKDVGVRFMPPYRFTLPDGVCKKRGNKLKVEVTNLGANRIRYNDRNGIQWKYFCNINMVNMHYRPFDASKWAAAPSGLLGPVRVSFRSPENP